MPLFNNKPIGKITMDARTERKIDRIAFRIHTRRGFYTGYNLKDYLTLKEKERAIAKSSEVSPISLEEVVIDIRRNGADETQLISKAFLSNTLEGTRNAYCFGHEGDLIVYFATGTYCHNLGWEMGLISSHVPGSPGGGGWGLNGHRKLQLARKPASEIFHWKKWVDNTLGYAYEHYDGKIHYDEQERGTATLLRIAIEQERAKIKKV